MERPLSDEHANGHESEQSLAQVRELLFGAQSRGFEQRCNELEERIARGFESLRNEINGKLDGIQQSLKDEIANVRGQVTSEQAERQRKMEEMSTKVDAAIKTRTDEMQSRISTVNDELRNYTLTQTQHVWDDIQSRHDNLNAKLENEVNQLRASSADRQTLGDMFRELATRLEEPSQVEQR